MLFLSGSGNDENGAGRESKTVTHKLNLTYFKKAVKALRQRLERF